MRDKGRRCLAVPCDVTDSASVNAMVDATLAEFGTIDILVNNAGGATDGFGNPLENITDQHWRVGVDTNLTGAMYCSRAVIPHMLERGSGKIINVTSGFGLRAARNNFMYTSRQGRPHQLHALPDDDLRPHHPGEPHRARPLSPRQPGDGGVVEARQIRPDGRLGKDEELGPLCVFLASDLTSYMNGQIIVLDGGGLAGRSAPDRSRAGRAAGREARSWEEEG